MTKHGHKQNNDANYLKEFATLHGSTDFSKKELQDWLTQKGLGPTARSRIWKKHESRVKQHEFSKQQHEFSKQQLEFSKQQHEKLEETRALAQELGVGDQLDSWLMKNHKFQVEWISKGMQMNKPISDAAFEKAPAEAFWAEVGRVMLKQELSKSVFNLD